MFLQNSWYVLGWSHELPLGGKPIGRVIIGQPIVVWRSDDSGTLHAAEDRCPHRHAPLSLGQVEGSAIRCTYHGMKLSPNGRCVHMPGAENPSRISIRIYPVVEKDSWIWVWTGDPQRADESLIPNAFGIDNPARPMRAKSIEYNAHYQLVHDNLCDLSHVDFVHGTTLRPATGASWSESSPRITSIDRAIRFERWFEDADVANQPDAKVDAWITYDFAVPGIFILRAARFQRGTAKRLGMQEPVGVEPLGLNIDQHAVTPINENRTVYHFATGLIGNSREMAAELAEQMKIIMLAFEEDRLMIEAQQEIWNLTSPTRKRVFLPQDKGPFLMRTLMQRLIRGETRDHANQVGYEYPRSQCAR